MSVDISLIIQERGSYGAICQLIAYYKYDIKILIRTSLLL